MGVEAGVASSTDGYHRGHKRLLEQGRFGTVPVNHFAGELDIITLRFIVILLCKKFKNLLISLKIEGNYF